MTAFPFRESGWLSHGAIELIRSVTAPNLEQLPGARAEPFDVHSPTNHSPAMATSKPVWCEEKPTPNIKLV